ncbi:hypothetical protein [Natrinema sp. 74]|uniref:DUF7344 domain-containing protein n=1 Tax=Natrinema sp. 74 TaxID=3384159 RepID=UPI0038D50154
MADRNIDERVGSDSIDAFFDVLNNAYRRSLCRYVMQMDGDLVTYEELVDHVLEGGPETASEDVERRTVGLELRHTHLPKLEAIDIIEYDPRNEAVRVDRAALADQLKWVSETVDDLQAAGTDREDE